MMNIMRQPNKNKISGSIIDKQVQELEKDLQTIACLSKFSEKIFLIKDSKFMILISNWWSFENKKQSIIEYARFYESSMMDREYLNLEQFFEEIPSKAKEELIFHLDLLK